MLLDRLGEALAPGVDGLVRRVSRVSPDALTVTGLALNGVACALFALAGGEGYADPDRLRWGGLVALAAAVFDMLDGRVARLRGRETQWGAFLDSTMDRYSDMLLYLGLMILYARFDDTPHMVLVWVAAFGTFLTSYTRARAESLLASCAVGILERPERLALIILGAVLNHVVGVLWLIAVLANLTAIQRIFYVHRELKRGEATGGPR